MDVAVRQRSGNDAVVVIGISLRFHQRHAAAGGATFEVGVLRVLVVEGFHNLLSFDGHLVRGAITEVDHLLRMADGPVTALFLMAGVGSGGCVSESQALMPV